MTTTTTTIEFGHRQLGASTTSGMSKRSASGVALETDHPLGLLSERRSILTSANGEDVTRRSTSASKNKSVLHLGLVLTAGESWLARKKKNGSFAVNAVPVHLLRRVTANVRKSSFAEERDHQPQSRRESLLLRHPLHRHRRSLLFALPSSKRSFTTIATSTTALNLLVNQPHHHLRLRRQVRLVKTTWKLRSIVPAHAMASTSMKTSSSSKIEMNARVAPVRDLEALPPAAHVLLPLYHHPPDALMTMM